MLRRTLCRSRSYRFVDGVDGAGSHSKEGKSTEEQAVHRGTPHLHHGVLKWHRQQEEGQDEVQGDDPRQDLQLVKRSLKTVPPLEFAVRIQRHGRVRRHLRRLWVHACTISHSDFTGASPCQRYAEALSIRSQGHSHCSSGWMEPNLKEHGVHCHHPTLSLAGSRGGPALFDAKAQESGGAR